MQREAAHLAAADDLGQHHQVVALGREPVCAVAGRKVIMHATVALGNTETRRQVLARSRAAWRAHAAP